MSRHEEAINFVLDAVAALPVARRLEMYYWLADICGDPVEAQVVRVMARELGEADARCREFSFGVPGTAGIPMTNLEAPARRRGLQRTTKQLGEVLKSRLEGVREAAQAENYAKAWELAKMATEILLELAKLQKGDQ